MTSSRDHWPRADELPIEELPVEELPIEPLLPVEPLLPIEPLLPLPPVDVSDDPPWLELDPDPDPDPDAPGVLLELCAQLVIGTSVNAPKTIPDTMLFFLIRNLLSKFVKGVALDKNLAARSMPGSLKVFCWYLVQEAKTIGVVASSFAR